MRRKETHGKIPVSHVKASLLPCVHVSFAHLCVSVSCFCLLSLSSLNQVSRSMSGGQVHQTARKYRSLPDEEESERRKPHVSPHVRHVRVRSANQSGIRKKKKKKRSQEFHRNDRGICVMCCCGCEAAGHPPACPSLALITVS